MTDIKNLVLGVTVAAVVLIVVAVPILGGLTVSSELKTIYADEYNGEDLEYHYMTLHLGSYPTLKTITYGAGKIILKYQISETETLTHAIPTSELDSNIVPLIIGTWETDGTPHATSIYGQGTSAYSPEIGTTMPLFAKPEVPLTKNGEYYEFVQDRIHITVSQDIAYGICPEEYGDTILAKTVKTDGTVKMVANMIVGGKADNVLFGDYSDVNESISLSQSNTYLALSDATLNTVTGSLRITHDDTGAIVSIDSLQVSTTTQTTITSNGYWLMARASYEIAIESPSEGVMSTTVWLLPVMLAVVLIASVAYQIVPKRRNNG